MFVIGNLIIAVGSILDFAISIYIWIIIIRAAMSWFNPDPYNRLVRFIVAITEPLLNEVRRIVPLLGGIDLSPMIVIILLYFTRSFVVTTILEIGHRLQ